MDLFAISHFGFSPEARDVLAFWSDIFGILGFVFALFGLIVGLMVNRKIKIAKAEAEATIDGFVKSQVSYEVIEARKSLELARETCRSRRWNRAEGHFDATIDGIIRLVSAKRLSVEHHSKFVELSDSLRVLRHVTRVKTNNKGSLTEEQRHRLDELIDVFIGVETQIRFEPNRGEKS